MSNAKNLSSTFVILTLSRIIGILRELLISIAFGFSRITDLFFQALFPINSITTVTNGPFTTAFGAAFNREDPKNALSFLYYYNSKAHLIGICFSALLLIASFICKFQTDPKISGLFIPLLILSSAGYTTLYSGYVYSVATSLGKLLSANIVMFSGNVSFVLGIVIYWLAGFKLQVWSLPLFFSIATFITYIFARRTIAAIIKGYEKEHNELGGGEIKKLPLPNLINGFFYSGTETIAFVLTQGFIISLAAHAGEGWTSALSITQRISLSVNGLIISPIASLLLIAIARRDKGVFNKSIKYFAAVFGLITFVSFFLVIFSFYGTSIVEKFTSFDTKNIDIIAKLSLGFAVWLFPLGMNVLVCRSMFALGEARIYTVVTLIYYAIANIARYIWFQIGDFQQAIIAGGVVEFIGVLILFSFTISRIKKIGV